MYSGSISLLKFLPGPNILKPFVVRLANWLSKVEKFIVQGSDYVEAAKKQIDEIFGDVK